MNDITQLQTLLEDALRGIALPDKPVDLYEPIRYFLALGGKRLRPALVLMAHEAFGGEAKDAIGPAVAVELFHNFSLVHDDIMDKAPMRRGEPTVHHKWNENVAILVGDAILVKAYEHLGKVSPEYLPALLRIFNKTALEVCEGQQYDMEFEERSDVTIPEYIEMIRLKTAVLVGAALKMGAVSAGADNAAAEAIYTFGESIGLAFQLQDDLLDAYGDQAKFGKQVGGDIRSNKKTFMLLKALEKAEGETEKRLRELIASTSDSDEKVEAVLEIYNALGVKEAARSEMEKYHHKGMQALETIAIDAERKRHLQHFATYLLNRDS